MRSLFSLFFLFVVFYIGNASAMTFSAPKHNLYDITAWVQLHGDATRIYADGDITDSTAQEFLSFVRTNNINNAIVLFNSLGGSLIGGMKLGKTIRDLKFNTGIATFSNDGMIENGICASACAYAYAGGLGRYYSGGKTKIGVHQFYSQNNSITNETSQEMSGMIVAYLQEMGVDALAFSTSTLVQSNDIYWLSTDEALKLNFANNGIQPTTAELKQTKGITYLLLEQRFIENDSKLMFTCNKKNIILDGGIVTNPKDAKDKYEWATHSFFTFDANTIQSKVKDSRSRGLYSIGSIIWVERILTPIDIDKLLASSNITIWVAADGAIGYTGSVDIRNVKTKIQDYINNCSIIR